MVTIQCCHYTQEGDLRLVKNSSRLVHSVATPLLFMPQWRKKIVRCSDSMAHRQDGGASADGKPVSRLHGVKLLYPSRMISVANVCSQIAHEAIDYSMKVDFLGIVLLKPTLRPTNSGQKLCLPIHEQTAETRAPWELRPQFGSPLANCEVPL